MSVQNCSLVFVQKQAVSVLTGVSVTTVLILRLALLTVCFFSVTSLLISTLLDVCEISWV